MNQLRNFASSVPDFRRKGRGNFKHKLEDFVILIVMANLSSCFVRPDIVAFGKKNLKKLQKMGFLLAGVPSEATLCRVEKGIDSEAMANLIADFTCPPDEGMTEGLKFVTIDAIGLQKRIIDLLRAKKYHFLIELKANQKSLCYGIEDQINSAAPACEHAFPVALEHGRIEKRVVRTCRGEDLDVDMERWGGDLTVVEVVVDETKKSNGQKSEGRRIYVTDLELDAETLGRMARRHWGIEVSHWLLDRNFKQDSTLRKHESSARNLDTLQRIASSIISIWRNKRRKLADKKKGMSGLLRKLKENFSALLRFLSQK